eukprot:3760806-Amphidinium_carterae.1
MNQHDSGPGTDYQDPLLLLQCEDEAILFMDSEISLLPLFHMRAMTPKNSELMACSRKLHDEWSSKFS